MSKVLTAFVLVFVLVTIGFAVPSGFRGHVFNSKGDSAKTQFHTIHVERLGVPGTSGHYYYWFQSRWHVNEDCDPPLVSGDWALYAVTYEDKKYYYSNWKVYQDYVLPSSTDPHDFHCTRTSPPPSLQ